MWQVVKDTKDGVMEANFYTDEWPNFSTIISQEFAPRLSRVRWFPRQHEGSVALHNVESKTTVQMSRAWLERFPRIQRDV